MATTIYKFQSDLKGLQQLNAGLKEAKKNLDALKRGTKEYAAASKDVGGMTQSLKNNASALTKTRRAANQLNKSGRGLMTTFKGASIAIISAFAFRAIMAGMRGLVTVFANFEAKMAAVKAISAATEKEFESLSESAKQLGETTVFTASQVAELQEELARLGFDPEEIVAMQNSILDLAAATGESLAKSAAIAGSQINAFGLEAEQTGRVTNTMGAAFSSSALNLERFTQSMKFVAPVAKTAGFTLEETTSLLMILADQGIHGSIAGNALKNVFLRLGDSNSKLNKSLDGTVQGLPQLIEEMRKMEAASFGLTEATDLLDKRSAPAFLALLRNIDDLDSAMDMVNMAEGDIQSMANTRLDTLEGDFTLLKSATEGLGLAVGQTFNAELRNAIYSLTKWVQSIASSEKSIQRIKAALTALMTAIQILVVRLAVIRLATFAFGGGLAKAAQGVRVLTVVMYRLVTGAMAASTAMNRLKIAMVSTGVGALVVGVGSLISYFMNLSDTSNDVVNTQERLNDAWDESISQIENLGTHSKARHDALRQMNNEYSELLGNIDMEVLSTKQLIAMKMVLNDMSVYEEQMKNNADYIADLKKTNIENEKFYQDAVDNAVAFEEEYGSIMIDTRNASSGSMGGTGFQDPSERKHDTHGTLSSVDLALKNQEEMRETYQQNLDDAENYTKNIIQSKIDEVEAFATQNDIILSNGQSLRMSERTRHLDSLEDFRTFTHGKQEEVKEAAEIELEDLERAQQMLDIHGMIVKAKADGQVDVQKEYESLLQKMRDGSNLRTNQFYNNFIQKQGHINVVISEMTKFVSNLTKNLDKSGKSYRKSALSGFRLQRTKDRFKELRKIQISQINDTLERDLAANEASFDNQTRKFKQEGKLIETNQRSIQKIIDKNEKKSSSKRHKQWVADLKANKNNYDVLKNMDIDEWEKLMDVKLSNNDDYLNILQDMMDEEVAKEETNLQIIEELKKKKANEELKIMIAHRAKMGELEREEARQLVNLNETDISNLISNQDARMKLLKDDHKEQERADQELFDLGEMKEIEFNNRKRARAEEMKNAEKKDRLEQLEAFEVMYSAMADVVMAVSASIAQTRMDNIQKEHEQRTEDLNNQFERDLELAEQHGGDTEAMQNTHDDKMVALEKIKEDKLRRIKRNQFILDKANSIAMTLINGAQAIAKVTSQTGVGAIVAAPVTSALIAAQLGVIMAQKFTGAKGGIIPGGDDKFADGGMVVGPSHANGGVKFAVGGRVAELEGGEAVINKRSTAMFHGQLSAMNAAGGGVRFETGGITPGTRAALDGAKGNWTAGDIAELISSSINSQQVYVTESEITSTQSNVGVTESLSTLF